MRTSRLFLAGAMMLALLTMSSAGLAQDASDPEAATYISGTRTWLENTNGASIHGMEMSDTRASGTATEYMLSWQEFGDTASPAVAAMVRIELVNDEGSWSGIGSGAYDPEMGWHIVAWLTGEEAFEGLAMYSHGTRTVYSTPEMEMEGVIFEGQVPAMAEILHASAE